MGQRHHRCVHFHKTTHLRRKSLRHQRDRTGNRQEASTEKFAHDSPPRPQGRILPKNALSPPKRKSKSYPVPPVLKILGRYRIRDSHESKLLSKLRTLPRLLKSKISPSLARVSCLELVPGRY